MLKKGKTLNYFKYALGEIILVMIGILLALQVNNWNERVKRSNKENALLEQLGYDLNSIYNDILGDLSLLELGQKSHYQIRDILNNEQSSYSDTLCFSFTWLAYDDYIYPKTSTFEKIKSEGIDIIKDDFIKSKTLTAFEVLFPRISKSNSYYPDINDYFDDYLNTHFKPNSDYNLEYSIDINDTELTYPYKKSISGKDYSETVGFVPLDFEALKKDTEFSMLMKNAQRFRSYKILRYNQAKDMVEELMEAIDNYLKNND